MAFNGWTDFGAQKISDAILSAGTPNSPGATLYFGGFTVSPTNVAGTGTQSLIVARAPVTANPTNFPPASGSGTVQIANGTPILYPAATAGTQEKWVAVGLWDALTAGNLWKAWPIPVAQQPTIAQGQVFQHGIAELVFQIISGANGGLSDFAMAQVLNHLFAGTALGNPANWFLAAFLQPPTSAGGGSESVDPTYARVTIPATLAAWPAASGAVNVLKGNASPAVFPILSAAGSLNWNSWGLYDANRPAGNLWYWGLNTSPLRVGSNSQVTYPANALQSILTSSS